MQYRSLGNTGLKVSALAYGGSSLGGVFRDIDEAEGIRSVHVAIDNGINLIDTAPYYGLTKAETVLGKALQGVGRDRYLLATKVARYGVGAEAFDFSAARISQSIDESLTRLGVDYVDFIQIHDIEFGHLPQIINESVPALRKAQAAGKARFVGITGLHLSCLLQTIDAVKVDQVQSYCHYCLHDDALANLLPRMAAQGIGVFNSAPLSMRMLTNEGAPSWHPATPEIKQKCAEAADFCSKQGVDIGKLALQFAVANESIHTNIIGTASPARVLENIRDASEPLDHDLLDAVLSILKPIHNQTWFSGIAENN